MKLFGAEKKGHRDIKNALLHVRAELEKIGKKPASRFF